MIKAGTSIEGAIKAIIEQTKHNGVHAHSFANDDEINVTVTADGVEITATPQSTEEELHEFWRRNK
jgi:hypothetical protein